MRQLQESNVTFDICQQSKADIIRASRGTRESSSGYNCSLGREQQLEDLHREYEVASSDFQRLRRGRDDYHDEAKAAETGLQRQEGEVAQREGVITRLTDQVDKMRGDSVNLRIKLDELRGQLTALRKEVQELRAIIFQHHSHVLEPQVAVLQGSCLGGQRLEARGHASDAGKLQRRGRRQRRESDSHS